MAGWLAAGTSAAQHTEQPLAQVISVEPGASCLIEEALVDHVATWLESNHVNAALRVRAWGDAKAARNVHFEIARDNHVVVERRFDPAPALCEHLHAALGLAIAMAIKASLLDEIAGSRYHAGGPVVPRRGAAAVHPLGPRARRGAQRRWIRGGCP